MAYNYWPRIRLLIYVGVVKNSCYFFGRIGPLALRPCVLLRAWVFLPHSRNILQIPLWYGDMMWYGVSCASPCALLRGPAFLMPLYHALKILSPPKMWLKGRVFYKSPCSPATQFWTPHRATSTELCKFMFLSWRLVDLFASFRTFFLNPRSCFAVEPNMQMVFSPTKHSLQESNYSHLLETESALQAQSNNKWHVVNLGYIFRLVGGFFPPIKKKYARQIGSCSPRIGVKMGK